MWGSLAGGLMGHTGGQWRDTALPSWEAWQGGVRAPVLAPGGQNGTCAVGREASMSFWE